MRDILEKYQSSAIGINLDKPFQIQKATLTCIAADYFSIMSTSDDCLHHFPYTAIVQLIENPDGVRVGGFFKHKESFPLVIKVGHLIEYTPI